MLFFYTKVLEHDFPWLQEIGRPQRHKRLPVVLSVEEVRRVLAGLERVPRLLAQLLYGTGLRIAEAR